MEPTEQDAIIRERKERKKVQNRLNQRARRSRLKEEKTDNKTDHRPYEVDRWRVHYSNGEATEKQLALCQAKPDLGRTAAVLHGGATRPLDIPRPLMDPIDEHMYICSTKSAVLKAYSSSLSADQLLDLIQFNVLRALIANKYSMSGKAQHYEDTKEGPLTPYLETVYPGNALFVPLSRDLPITLLPTQLQITVPHSTWIDLLPFPRMRDNLIQSQHQFDHAELANDIIGNLIDLSQFFRPKSDEEEKSQTASGGVRKPGPRGVKALQPPRGGFIVYGPPHKVESWEVTPEFVWKWGWTLMGCKELIESTNRWRQTRGEAPLPMIITRPWHSNSLSGPAGLSA